jgi:hypothetical protein
MPLEGVLLNDLLSATVGELLVALVEEEGTVAALLDHTCFELSATPFSALPC